MSVRGSLFTFLSLSALAAGVLGLVGVGLKNVLLIGFILGFISVLVFKAGLSKHYHKLFASSIAGGFVASIMAFILYILLKIIFIAAVILIILYFAGMLFYIIKRRSSW